MSGCQPFSTLANELKEKDGHGMDTELYGQSAAHGKQAF